MTEQKARIAEIIRLAKQAASGGVILLGVDDPRRPSPLAPSFEPHQEILQGEVKAGMKDRLRRVFGFFERAMQPGHVGSAAPHQGDHPRFEHRDVLSVTSQRDGQLIHGKEHVVTVLRQLRNLLLDRLFRRLRHFSNLLNRMRRAWPW